LNFQEMYILQHFLNTFSSRDWAFVFCPSPEWPFPLFTRFCIVVLSELNKGGGLRRQDRQAVVDGPREGAVSRDGEEGHFAKGEIKFFRVVLWVRTG